MASYKAADTYITEFATQRFDTGTATDADILPTATASLNGVTDGSFSLTVANITTGHYKITGTIPSYSSGDVINITVVATVNSVVGKEVIDTFVIDSKRNSDLNDFDPLNDIVANVTLVDTTTDVSNGVTLANDAITSAKYDESTAFPIKSADTGITQIARTGADGDTLETLSDQSDAIDTKTTNLPASPAAVGSEMNLANDAITSAKYDESTAFPIKSVDTGSTQIARTGADADTLKTLSDQADTAQTDLDTLTGADGSTLATLQPNFTPAIAGDNMNLADDAITSAKYDESTAFPLKSIDSGSTEIARTGADGDTLETLSDQSDVINAKTTNLPASPAAVGSEMNLANDSITSAKYDESTAFPIKSVDTGSTQIARTGADADTLETLSDQVDATSTHTPANVVASLFSATPTAGGVTTFEEITNILYSMARGKIIRSNNEYAFYDDDDVTLLFTMTVAAGSRTVS